MTDGGYGWAEQKAEWDRERFPERFALSTLARAIAFASSFHDGQLDKAGRPAIYHPLAVAYKVAEAGGDEEQQAAAVLHDTIEDTAACYSEIFHHFGSRVGLLVEAMTHRTESFPEPETYGEYIARIQAMGPEAVLIKICDIEHNIERSYFSRPGELRTPTSGWVKREFAGLVKRYRKALKILRRDAEEPGKGESA